MHHVLFFAGKGMDGPNPVIAYRLANSYDYIHAEWQVQ